MSNQDIKQFNLQTLADEVATRPAPESCEEIARLLTGLPLSGKNPLLQPPVTPTARNGRNKTRVQNAFNQRVKKVKKNV